MQLFKTKKTSQNECKCHQTLFNEDPSRFIKLGVQPIFDNIKKTHLYALLRPCFIVMRIFGLCFPRTFSNAKHTRVTGSKVSRGKYENISMAYSFIICSSQWVPLVFGFGTLLAVGAFDPFALVQLMSIFWTFHSATAAACSFFMFANPNRFLKICSLWQELIWCKAEKDAVEKRLRLKSRLLLLCVMIYNAQNTIGKNWDLFTTFLILQLLSI